VVDETSSDVPGRATNYLTPDSIADYDHRTTGADGIYSSVSDMHEWMLSFEDHTLLSAATVDSMFVSHEGGGFGYGWYVGSWSGVPAHYEASIHPASRTFIGTVRARDLSYVLLGSGAYDWAPELPSLILAYELGF
jgi:hypothetical protein